MSKHHFWWLSICKRTWILAILWYSVDEVRGYQSRPFQRNWRMKISIKHLLTLLTCIIVQVTVFGQLDFLGFYPSDEENNDIWGYEDSLGNQYVLLGQNSKTLILDVTDPTNIIPLHSVPVIKVFGGTSKRGTALPMSPMKKGWSWYHWFTLPPRLHPFWAFYGGHPWSANRTQYLYRWTRICLHFWKQSLCWRSGRIWPKHHESLPTHLSWKLYRAICSWWLRQRGYDVSFEILNGTQSIIDNSNRKPYYPSPLSHLLKLYPPVLAWFERSILGNRRWGWGRQYWCLWCRWPIRCKRNRSIPAKRRKWCYSS